jgi:hypothetical protein
MKPVVLLVGKLRDVIGATAEELDHMPVEWLGAHNREEVIEQLDAEPKIACAIIGGSLDDHLRGELVSLIASSRPDICIHVKDRASGPSAFTGFVQRVVEGMLFPA